MNDRTLVANEMKKAIAILVLGFLFCNNVMAEIDIFAHNKSLDYNFICVAPNKAHNNDWSDIRRKIGFVRVDSEMKTGPKKILLYALWNTKYNNYDKVLSAVNIRYVNDEYTEMDYIWHSFYNNVKSQSGEKVPMIHTSVMSK